MWVTDDHRGNQRVRRNYSFALYSEVKAYLYFYTKSVPKIAYFKWQFISLSSSCIRSSMIHESNQCRLANNAIHVPQKASATYGYLPATRIFVGQFPSSNFIVRRFPISGHVAFRSRHFIHPGRPMAAINAGFSPFNGNTTN